MKPLWFLTTRVLVNSLKRAFGNPLRAILTLLVLGFFFLTFAGNVLSMFFGDSKPPPMPANMMLDPRLIVDKLIGLMTLLHLALVAAAFFPSTAKSYAGFFLEPDVNYLFPTPLKRFKVFRFLVLARGMFGSLMLMLLIVFYYAVFGRRSLMQLSALNIEPQVGPWGLMTYPLIYSLMTMGLLFVSVNIGIRAYHNPALWKRVWLILGVGLGGVAVAMAFFGLQAAQNGESVVDGLIAGMNHPVLYALLIPLRAPADAAMIVYNGWSVAVVLGAVFWLGVLVAANRALKTQDVWLYEYAGASAQKRARAVSAQQNPLQAMMDRVAEDAQKGKIKTLRVPFLERWRPTGVWALFWRDLLIGWRLGGMTNLIMLTVILLLGAGALMAVKIWGGQKADKLVVVVAGLSQYIIALLFIVGSLYGIMDILKRMDFQKPMPLPASHVVLIEVLPTILTLALLLIPLTLISIALFPQNAGLWLYLLFIELSFMLPISLGLLILVLMNPDQTDYTQRLLLGVLMFPIIFLCGAPGLILLGLSFYFKVPLVINAVLVLGANAMATVFLTTVAANRYESFNPLD